MVERYADALRSQRAIWIDAGTRDEWFLDLGAVAFRAELSRIGVPEDRVQFELFDATHAAIDYRYPIALSWLAHDLGEHIEALDANPVIVGVDGCVAVDALVVPRRSWTFR